MLRPGLRRAAGLGRPGWSPRCRSPRCRTRSPPLDRTHRAVRTEEGMRFRTQAGTANPVPAHLRGSAPTAPPSKRSHPTAPPLGLCSVSLKAAPRPSPRQLSAHSEMPPSLLRVPLLPPLLGAALLRPFSPLALSLRQAPPFQICSASSGSSSLNPALYQIFSSLVPPGPSFPPQRRVSLTLQRRQQSPSLHMAS